MITLVSAAPAFAASGDSIGEIEVSYASILRRDDGPLSTPEGDLTSWNQGEVQVMNLSLTEVLPAGLILTLTFAGGWLEGAFFDIQPALPGGWAAQGLSAPTRTDIAARGATHMAGGQVLYDFVFPSLDPQGEITLSFDVVIPTEVAAELYDVIGLTLTPPTGWHTAPGTTGVLSYPAVT